jgi:MFS family permease
MPAPSSPPGLAALDWLNFFVATLQTGFGPFIAGYLTAGRWTQAEIGIALGVGTAATVLSQVPAGALVDAMRSKVRAALIATLLIAGSAVLFALRPERWPVMIAEVLHGFASCMLAPAIAAATLALVGREGFAGRIGRNARFAGLGNAAGALAMGLAGTLAGSRMVFWLAAALAVPSVGALCSLPRAPPAAAPAAHRAGPWRAMLDGQLALFALCVALFHLCNAALLPLAAGILTKRAGSAANLLIAACIVGPQVVVAALSPAIALGAERWGRRPVMLAGFAALPLRALIFAARPGPDIIVAAELLDGVSAATFGVLLPLVAADLTRGSGRFNLCLGILGLAVGVGATLSTVLGGWLASDAGTGTAFLALAGAGAAAVVAVAVAMPETRWVAAPQG